MKLLELYFYRQKGRYYWIIRSCGCFSGNNDNCAWIIRSVDITPEIISEYTTTAVEADNRIWCHATQTVATKVLTYSPDTDVCTIGLSILNHNASKDFIVQLNICHFIEIKFVILHHLKAAFLNDPDLSHILREKVCSVM